MSLMDRFMNSEVARSVGDPFDQKYGPTPNCFSTNDLKRMFRQGALARDVEHLKTGCESCRDRVYAYAGRKPLVFFPGPVTINVGEKRASAPIHMQILTSPLHGLGHAEVSLEGALQCTGQIDDEGWVEFPEVLASDEVIDDLRRHLSVTEQVWVRATGSNETQVVGESFIDLGRG